MQLNRDFEIYRWFMPILLHTDFLHIITNVLTQLIVGGFIEQIFGRWRTLAVYVCAGIGGILFGCLISDDVSVGASGAIFGICGALVCFRFCRDTFLETLKKNNTHIRLDG